MSLVEAALTLLREEGWPGFPSHTHLFIVSNSQYLITSEMSILLPDLA